MKLSLFLHHKRRYSWRHVTSGESLTFLSLFPCVQIGLLIHSPETESAHSKWVISREFSEGTVGKVWAGSRKATGNGTELQDKE